MDRDKIATVFGVGFIGRYLIRELTKRGYRCIIPTRSSFQKGYLKTQAPPGAIEFIDWKQEDLSKIKESIANSDIVINLIGQISKNHKIIGPRQGEKLQEILITEDEKQISQEKTDMWIIQNYP